MKNLSKNKKMKTDPNRQVRLTFVFYRHVHTHVLPQIYGHKYIHSYKSFNFEMLMGKYTEI